MSLLIPFFTTKLCTSEVKPSKVYWHLTIKSICKVSLIFFNFCFVFLSTCLANLKVCLWNDGWSDYSSFLLVQLFDPVLKYSYIISKRMRTRWKTQVLPVVFLKCASIEVHGVAQSKKSFKTTQTCFHFIILMKWTVSYWHIHLKHGNNFYSSVILWLYQLQREISGSSVAKFFLPCSPAFSTVSVYCLVLRR